jgi:hypothetical protein
MKLSKMFAASTLAILSAMSAPAWAAVDCTKEPKSAWKDQDAFQTQLKADGYEIAKFKVTSGNCYEIYGKDKEGRKVEIYFNPVDGTKVKEKVK